MPSTRKRERHFVSSYAELPMVGRPGMPQPIGKVGILSGDQHAEPMQ